MGWLLQQSNDVNAEPESPGYLAFRSEPDFRRSAEKMSDD
jgi:hypothetical protein